MIKPLSTVLSSAVNKSQHLQEKNSQREKFLGNWSLNPGPLGAKRECYPLCYVAPSLAPPQVIFFVKTKNKPTTSLAPISTTNKISHWENNLIRGGCVETKSLASKLQRKELLGNIFNIGCVIYVTLRIQGRSWPTASAIYYKVVGSLLNNTNVTRNSTL